MKAKRAVTNVSLNGVSENEISGFVKKGFKLTLFFFLFHFTHLLSCWS